MIKKINSEYKVNDNNKFIVTMGTYNKKNPDVIYSIISTYITPKSENINDSIFNDISKRISKNIKKSINNIGICENNVIVVSDVASNRMLCGKPTYFDMEIYFKPQKNEIETNKFKDISKTIYDTYVKNVLTNIEDVLTSNDFEISKYKNKVEKRTI